MNNLKLSFLIISSLFIKNNSFGQEKHFCGQVQYQEKLYKSRPDLRPENNSSFKRLESFTQRIISEKKTTAKENKINATGLTVGYDYIIPVVVHVIHNNGYENLSDKTIERAIEMLNSFYAGTSAWDKYESQQFLNIRGGFNGNGKKIKFVLAKFDPNGKPTSGIDRKVDSYYTLRGDYPTMRQLYNWPRKNYFNIYIVKQAVQNDGRSGFATFPFEVANATDAIYDGHIMSAWAFGEHTEMFQTWYHNLAHEVGHWLNVYHIWDKFNENQDPKNCISGDDLVADTPITTGNKLGDFDLKPAVGSIDTCPTQNGIDNYTNMMDYTAATYAMFTQGQKDRMVACLESSEADRNNLWSKANVLAKLYGCTSGTDTDNDGIPDACDPCPTSATNDLDEDGVCDSNDLCNGFPDVNFDSNPLKPDACDPLLPIVNFNLTPFVDYDASIDKGVGFTYDNGATFFTSLNACKAVPKNYKITPNTIIEFDFKSTIQGQTHYIGFETDLVGQPVYRYKIFGSSNEVNSSSLNTNFNTYTTADLYAYKHYKIPVGQYYTGNFNYLIFAAKNDLMQEGVWNISNTFAGGGSYNEATSFFRNVKIYENTVLSNDDGLNENYSVTAYSIDKSIMIESTQGLDQVEVFNLLGQELLVEKNISDKMYISKAFNDILVIAKITLKNGQIITKKINLY